MLQKIENWFFKFKFPVLLSFVLLTIVMGYYAVQIRMDAGFYKQLPNNHSFVKTYYQYQDDLSGTNSITVALRVTEGDIFNSEYFGKLYELNQAIRYLPGVNQGSMQSLWTPNVRALRVTEEGFESTEVIPGFLTPEKITTDEINKIKERILVGGHVGSIVSNDFTSSLIKVELTEYNRKTGKKLDYLQLGQEIETIRNEFEKDIFRVEITGFAKMISDIANEAYNVVIFFGLAFLLTVLAVYWYSRSWTLTFLPLICSLTSLVWQFGMLKILGFGLDPLAILVPFLVFAIGVSHGIQQVNQITKEVIEGQTAEYAARASFSRLLIPGSMALITDLVGFGTLILLPIGMIQELGITASIGVAFKIITNLVMLPLAASYARYNDSFAERAQSAISYRQNLMGFFGKLARPRQAVVTLSVTVILFIGAAYLASDRHVGDLHAGAPELRPEARFNQDINELTKRYNVTTDVLVVITEALATGGLNPCRSTYIVEAQDNLHWYLENIPGVTKVISLSSVAKTALSGYAEGNLKWSYLPRNAQALGFATSVVDPSTGLINESCTIMPIYVFTEDHKATTISTVIEKVNEYNEKFRELDDTLTFKTLISRPAEGTDVIPRVDNLGGEETNIEDLQDIENPKIFTDDEFTNFGYESGFNTRNILLGPGLLNYYRDIDSFDDKVNFRVKDIKQSEISIKEFFLENPEFENLIFEYDEIKNRLASGSVGIQHATNEVIEKGELPMMIIVYVVIVILVFVTYLDWRATICCTIPLTLATMLGYAFMDLAQIGLKVSTLPVMVLAVGVGVDYAFYIYNRTQLRLKEGMNITEAFEHTFANTGAAVVFTAITLAIGVSTWSFSALKFQADMGSLLTFMFLINMLCAMTTLPALAVILDKLFPRSSSS